MQSEFTASAVAWGFSTFSKNKCVVKVFHTSSPPSASGNESSAEPAPDNSLLECSPNEPIIVSQGTSFEIGLELSPSSTFTDTNSFEEFVASFEKHKELLKFNLQMQLRGGGHNFLPRETADVQKCRGGHHHSNPLDSVIFRRRPGGFYIGET